MVVANLQVVVAKLQMTLVNVARCWCSSVVVVGERSDA
jgi:hypothetical protein